MVLVMAPLPSPCFESEFWIINPVIIVRDVNYLESKDIDSSCLHDILVFKGTSKEIITFRVH